MVSGLSAGLCTATYSLLFDYFTFETYTASILFYDKYWHPYFKGSSQDQTSELMNKFKTAFKNHLNPSNLF